MTDSDITVDDLDLDIRDLVVPSYRGRRPVDLQHTYVRDLEESDIILLQTNPVLDVEHPSIQKLKSSHHTLARLLAEGRPNAECALITGYSLPRISILKHDPAFCELMAYYASQVQEVYVSVHERLSAMSLDALEELHDRLLDPEQTLSNAELMKLVELGFDRAGYGPKSTQVHEHRLGFDALLNVVKDEVRTRTNGNIKTLDARPNVPSPPDHIPSDLGLDIAEPAGEHSPVSGEGSESGGAAVRAPGGQETPRSEFPSPANENGSPGRG